jgi:SAM-dependent methyltransferase
MTLTDEYKRQYQWRDWQAVYGAVPIIQGCTILDLGCAIGDQSAALSELGATVIGVDADEKLIEQARSRQIPNASFHVSDLRSLTHLGLPRVDGIWTSFTAAYFPNLTPILREWSSLLKPKGWLAAVEMDDLFGHTPLKPQTVKLIEDFYTDSTSQGRYDFRMGSTLRSNLEGIGFTVDRDTIINDAEFSFQGAAQVEVLEAWRNRLARMKGLQRFAGDRFETFQSEFLAALSDPSHTSRCKVNFVLGRLKSGAKNTVES